MSTTLCWILILLFTVSFALSRLRLMAIAWGLTSFSILCSVDWYLRCVVGCFLENKNTLPVLFMCLSLSMRPIPARVYKYNLSQKYCGANEALRTLGTQCAYTNRLWIWTLFRLICTCWARLSLVSAAANLAFLYNLKKIEIEFYREIAKFYIIWILNFWWEGLEVIYWKGCEENF